MKRFLARAALILVLVLDAFLLQRLVLSRHGLTAFHDMQAKYGAILKEQEEVDRRSLVLSQEIRWLKADDEYLQNVIRSRANLLKDNEILYVFPEREADRTAELRP